jgi:hypothetical protein
MEQAIELSVESVEIVQDNDEVVELSHEILDRIGGGTISCVL